MLSGLVVVVFLILLQHSQLRWTHNRLEILLSQSPPILGLANDYQRTGRWAGGSDVRMAQKLNVSKLTSTFTLYPLPFSTVHLERLLR